MRRFLISLIVLIAFVLAGTIFIKNASAQPTGVVFTATCEQSGPIFSQGDFFLPDERQGYNDFKKGCREGDGTLSVCQCECHTLFSFSDSRP